MKQILFLVLSTLLSYFIVSAQTPASIPYQAVARNSSGNLLQNQLVGLRFTVRQSTSAGAAQYQETQTATTNKLGLFNVNIGAGTRVSGTFGGITWSDGQAKFLQVEIDPSGGTAYTDMGATQMMSVPYALYAGSANSVTSSNLTESTSNVLSITGGTGSVVSAAGTSIQVRQASTSQDGFLSSTDWNTFNGKQHAITLTTSGTNGLATFNAGTGALNIPGYTLAGLGGIGLTGLSANAPLSYNSGTGAFSITQASASANGYLSSADWNTFNNKQGALTFNAPLSLSGNAVSLGYDNSTIKMSGGNLYAVNTGSVSSIATTAPLTGGTITTTGTIGITQATGSTSGYLSSTDWNTFNNKVSGTSTQYYVPYWTATSATTGNLSSTSQIYDNGTAVGIGTASPTQILTVVDAGNADKYSGTFGVFPLNLSQGISIGYCGISEVGANGNNAMYLNAQGNGSLVLQNVGTGNVGIGNVSPAYNLDVTGSFRVLSTSSALSVSGGSSTTSGAYTVVTFTSSGTFTPSGPLTVDVLVVGGGGGGGGNGGGGGGAGGVVENTSYTITGPVTVTVGTGGAGCVNQSSDGSNGNPSSFGSVTAFGGGGGASRSSGQALGLTAGNAGNTSSTASGGGGGGCSGGSACTPGYGTSGQGNSGGYGYSSGSCNASGAGGGGAGGAGGYASSNTGGSGGAGIQYANFTTGGSPAGWYGGGGGGAAVCYNPSTGGSVGSGGGGAGSNGTAGTTGTAGLPNTGGGGGGGGSGANGSAGGSGIVIIRYLTASAVSDPTVIATSGSNVGIGTTTPTSTLQVQGSFQTTSMKTVTYTNSITNSGHFQISASCGNGGTLLSGGCYDNGDDIAGNTGTTALSMSYPVNSTTWRCGSRDIVTPQTRTLTAYAICTQ